VAEGQSAHRVLEARLRSTEAKAGKEMNRDERELLEHEARQIARDLAAHHRPELPQFTCDDVTCEKLANLLAVHGGKMFQASAEGTAFEIIKGRYSEHANFDVYLKGHAGDTLRIHRISRDDELVVQPALSVALAVQPDVIRGLAEVASMR